MDYLGVKDPDAAASLLVNAGINQVLISGPGGPEATPRHANDHRDFAAPAVADLCGVVHELVEAGGDEVVELDLADRPETRESGPDTDT